MLNSDNGSDDASAACTASMLDTGSVLAAALLICFAALPLTAGRAEMLAVDVDAAGLLLGEIAVAAAADSLLFIEADFLLPAEERLAMECSPPTDAWITRLLLLDD